MISNTSISPCSIPTKNIELPHLTVLLHRISSSSGIGVIVFHSFSINTVSSIVNKYSIKNIQVIIGYHHFNIITIDVFIKPNIDSVNVNPSVTLITIGVCTRDA